MLVPDLGRPVDIGGQTVAVAAESGLQAADFCVQNLHKEWFSVIRIRDELADCPNPDGFLKLILINNFKKMFLYLRKYV